MTGKFIETMKPKLVLWLAFVLSGGLCGCPIAPSQAQAATRTTAEGTWAKTLKTPWTDTKVVLYRADGQVVQLDAKEAVYTVWSTKNPENQHKPFDFPMAAFIDPATRNVWIGGVNTGQVETNEGIGNLTYTNLFVETHSQIVRADNVMYDGIIDWDESLIKEAQPGEGLERVIDQFDKATGGSLPFYQAQWEINVSSYFRDGFFSIKGWMHCSIEMQHIEISNGKLRLDFTSPAYKTKGSVWLDLNKGKVLKAIEYK